MTINLKMPDSMSELKPRITVFGVGGAGGNAVNNMIQEGLDGVEFVVANTDAQALAMSSADRRIQMGTAITEGLGAGSQPTIGAASAQEAQAEILDYASGAHMVFITAGMGGGTGTGAAPVIAQLCREQNILTVAVVTKPFQFEGARRMQIAEDGISELMKHVDTLIVIPNQNLFRIANERTTFSDAFAMADQVLLSGVQGITDLMVKEGLINLDFADVKSIMQGMGKAMMGTGEASGEKRAIEAAEAAIANPLLDEVSMKGAQGLLISITGGEDLTLYEVDEAASRIRNEVDKDANIILGATFDPSMEGSIKVSVVATGIQSEVNAGSYNTTVDNIDYRKSNKVGTSFSNFNFGKTLSKDNNVSEKYSTDKNSDSKDDIVKTTNKEEQSDVTFRKIDSNHSFYNSQSRPVISEDKNINLNKSFTPKASIIPDVGKEDIPKVNSFFSMKDDNVTVGMQSDFIDKYEDKKGKKSLFERLINVGSKKKVSQSHVNEPNFVETDFVKYENEAISGNMIPNESFDDNNPLDNELNDDKFNYDLHGFELEDKDTQAADEIIDYKEMEDGQFDESIAEKDDDNLEIPAFLRRQAN
ncbi:MAG: cell division protein FtsZ [Alphaproteobacteria bacterium]|jgi:cell division protein FtsZ|tara:strand:- start:28177 stop:29943 length:1767 start_codon:yes stop_codon:yes gene_type:complete